MSEVSVRWATFLSKIEAAFETLMRDGRAGCLSLAGSHSTVAMSNAWQGVRAEVFALVEKIDSTWRDKVEAAFTGEGIEGSALLEQEQRGRDLGHVLLHRLERCEIEVFGEAAEAVLSDARVEAATTAFTCSQCGARLPKPEHLFNAVQVNCEHCRAVNMLEPGTLARMVEHFCAHHLSHRAALPQWELMTAAHRVRRATRGESPEIRAQIEVATRAYWRAYFTARATLVPMPSERIELEVNSRLRGLS